MTNDYDSMNRRSFMRLGAGAAAAAAITGCRAAFRPLADEDAPHADALYKQALAGDTIDGMVDKSVQAFVTPRTYGSSNVAWPSHIAQLGIDGQNVSGALVTIQGMNDNVVQMLRGYPVLMHQVVGSLYGAREEITQSLKLDDDGKKKFVKEFMTTITEEQKERLSKLHDARVLLDGQLKLIETYDGVLTTVRDKSYAADNEALTKQVRGLVDAFDKNAAELQAYTVATLAAMVCEGQWGDGVRQRIQLDDGLQYARGHQSYLAKGKAALNRKVTVDGKEKTLKELIDVHGANADKHFRTRDANYQDDVFQDNRDPVAHAAFKQLYVPGKILATDHRGILHALDMRLCDASAQTYDSLLGTIAELLWFVPGYNQAHSLANDWPYLFTSNSPNGNLKKVVKTVLDAYMGPTNLPFRAGDEDPAGRALLTIALTAVEGALLAAGNNRSSKNGRSSGQGVGGGQTTTPGVTTQGN